MQKQEVLFTELKDPTLSHPTVSGSGADTQSAEAVHTQALCSSRERSAELSDRHWKQKDTYQVKRERTWVADDLRDTIKQALILSNGVL